MADDLQNQAPSPFDGTRPIATLAHAGGTVTLVEGQTFSLSGRTGDMDPSLPHGLFVHDTRVLSRWELRVGGDPLEPLTVDVPDPFDATFVGRARPPEGQADADIVVFRSRSIGWGMRERISLTNHGLRATEVSVELICDADFADLFAVKESRVHGRGRHPGESTADGVRFTADDRRSVKATSVRCSRPPAAGHLGTRALLRWSPRLAPRETWELCLDVGVTLGGELLEPRFSCRAADAVPR